MDYKVSDRNRAPPVSDYRYMASAYHLYEQDCLANGLRGLDDNGDIVEDLTNMIHTYHILWPLFNSWGSAYVLSQHFDSLIKRDHPIYVDAASVSNLKGLPTLGANSYFMNRLYWEERVSKALEGSYSTSHLMLGLSTDTFILFSSKEDATLFRILI